MKRLLYTFLGLIALVLLGVFIFINIPKASVEAQPPLTSITASELFTAFENDEATANSKYIGEVVEVIGTIADKFKDETDAPVLLITNGDELKNVMCSLDATQLKKFESKKVGHPIKVKGQCTGFLMEVVLNKGVILN